MREYWIDIGGIPHSVQLTEEEAKRIGASDSTVEPEKPVRTRARRARNKEA